MTSWSDCKDDEKLEATLRSLVATNPKQRNIRFSLPGFPRLWIEYGS